MCYLDNASTSFPKPPEVVAAITQYLQEFGVSPGRGSYHLANKAEELVLKTRTMLAKMIGTGDVNNVVFTQNATHSLNIVIKGFLKPGDHVLLCSYCHNSVIRPLDALKRQGLITYDVFEVGADGQINLDDFQKLLKANTRLVIGNHVSNVIGVISEIMHVAEICKENDIKFLLDCTQSLGYVPLHVDKMPIDFLAGTGHKTLMGPSGVGFLYIKNPKLIETFIHGGSAGNHSTSPYHPMQMPYKFEAGTLNTTSIAGLKGGLEFIMQHDIASLSRHCMELTKYAWNQLRKIDEVILFGTDDMTRKVPIISFTIAGALTSEVAYYYDHAGICVRPGLQCAPLIHKSLGTLPSGTIRISFGHYNSFEDIDRVVSVTNQIILEAKYAKTCA